MGRLFDKKIDIINNHCYVERCGSGYLFVNKKRIDLELLAPGWYTPKDTKLKNQEIIKTSNGERLIQTFNGESSFTLIQETNNNLEYTNKFCEGEPIILNDVTGYIDDYSITWYDDNYSYYIVSKDLSQNELLQIASSITSPTIIK